MTHRRIEGSSVCAHKQARRWSAICAAVLAAISAVTRVGAADPVLPPGFVWEWVGAGWTQPAGVTFDPSPQGAGRAYVWDRPGRVWILENGVRRPTPMLNLSEEVGWYADFGLLGFALDPKFHENGHVYCLYVVDRHHLLNAGTPAYSPTTNESNAPTIGRITRFTARASDGFRTVDPASRRVLVGETKDTGFPILHLSHGPGALAFATDGTLLVSFGNAASFETLDDGGSDGHSMAPQALADGILKAKEDVGAFRSQLLDCLNGKLLRIDPSTGNGVPSNPFYESKNPRSARSRVWALGLRNPFRFCIRPNTGGHLPSEGDPGVILVGDVGENSWEELLVVDRPAMNFGWPLFEGMTETVGYQLSPAVNLDAPNPLGGFFRFADLIVQETAGLPSWPNPKNPALQIPAQLPRFVHIRPALDYGHDPLLPGPVRIPIARGGAVVTVGNSNALVEGAPFSGACALAGCFYTGSNFPPEYHGALFFSDFEAGWVKALHLDESDRPTRIADFGRLDRNVSLSVDPASGALYFVDVIGSRVGKIVYAPGGNLLPLAAASADVSIGLAPLVVRFSAEGSIDPEGQPLAYLWDFGDGGTSALRNPTHSFTGAGTAVRNVRLTVTDPQGGSASSEVNIFVNHTLPEVVITSPLAGTKYPVGAARNFRLSRRVAEVPGHPTTTRWEVFLHHDDHEHPDPPIDLVEPTVAIPPVFSSSDTYFYRIQLTVTDDLGASVRREVKIFPNTANLAPAVAWSSGTKTSVASASPCVIDAQARIVDLDSAGLEGGQLGIGLAGARPDDRIALLPDSVVGLEIHGAAVLFGGTEVATWSGGIAAQPLTLSFNEAASPEIARAIVRRAALIAPTAGPRTVRMWMNDGDGAGSNTASLAWQITPRAVLKIAKAAYRVDEAAGAISVTVQRTANLTLPAWASYLTRSGVAIAGADFQETRGTLYFAPGQTTATVSVPILPDTLAEPDEAFSFAIEEVSTDVTRAEPSSATITIVNNQRPALQFSSPSFEANEDDGVARISVWRTGSTAAAVSVKYTSAGGSASAGVEYGAVSGTLSFAPGESAHTIQVPIWNNRVSAADVTVNLKLSAPSAGAILGAQSWTVLRIIDEDEPAGVVQFNGLQVWGNEGDGPMRITVHRNRATTEEVAVSFRTISGSGIAERDFRMTSGTARFAPGELTTQIVVPLLDDMEDEGDEFFRIELLTASGGAKVGARKLATAFIVNDDTAGGLIEIAGDLSVPEGGGFASVDIVRKGNISAATSVGYMTGPLTASSGEDYIHVIGALDFAPGETRKRIPILIHDDTVSEASESLGFALFNPSAGAVLGARSWATVTILDDD